MEKVKPQIVLDLDNTEKPVKVKIRGEIKTVKVTDIRSDVYMNIKSDSDAPKNRYKIILIEES